MLDLNDLYHFHAVVAYQGFSAASRQTGIPKGTLSKRIARLEERLQVRLLERSTRKVRTTDVGQTFYEHCQAVLAGAEAAEAVVAQARAEPSGMVRLSCPQGLLQNLIEEILPGFMQTCPKVRVNLKVFNRRADLVEDRVDIALRARTRSDIADASLIVRPLGQSHLVLAASPALVAEWSAPLTVERLAQMPTLSMESEVDEAHWELAGPGGETHHIPLRPRMLCGNFGVLLAAAKRGLGVALLPMHVCRPSFDAGELVHVLPDWRTPYGTIQAVFSSRKGIVPAVRALIDYLAEKVPARFEAGAS